MLQLYLLSLVAAFAARTAAQTSSTSSLSSTLLTSVTSSSSSASTSSPSSTSTSNSSSTSSTAITTHTISVGAGGFVYTPNQVNASVGDIIQFLFYPGGHTVVRSDYKYPCVPYELTGAGHVGFYSGELSPLTILTDPPKFDLRINDTDPIFFYCSAPGSCYQHQMIGVINSNPDTFNIQMQFALNATYQLEPGQSWPSETASVSTAAPTSTSTASSDTTSSSRGSSLSAGAIAGIAIGAAAALVMTGTIIYLCGRRGGINLAYRNSRATFGPPMPFTPKSPGGVTFSTAQYSPPPNHQDAYRTQTPQPPMSPNSQTTFVGTYPGMVSPGMHSPLMEGFQAQHGYLPGQPTPPPDSVHSQQQVSPAELPATSDPVASPLPDYESRHFSWTQGSEGRYRPSSASN